MTDERLNELLLKAIAALKATEDALLSNKTKALEIELELIRLREALPQWISVEDKLPERAERYLVAGVSYRGLEFVDSDDWCVAPSTGERYWWKYPSDVTHWMPLPEPPEMEDDL